MLRSMVNWMMVMLIALIVITQKSFAGIEEVSFRHKTESPPVYKMMCNKYMGKNDVLPTYACYDGDDNLIEFDPGKEWEEVLISKVCFQHKLRDSIRIGYKIEGKADKSVEYARILKNKGVKAFIPKEKKWNILTEDHPSCAKHVIEIDPLRSITILKPDETNGDASAKKGE